MPSTSRFAIPYPSPDDNPDGPAQMQALAERVDSAIVSPFAGDLKFSARASEHGNWIKADGRALTAGQYDALRNALIADGSPYGNTAGNPRLPDMQTRAPVGAGGGYTHGTAGGEATHTLTPGETALREHQHHVSSHNLGGSAPATMTAGGKAVIRGDDGTSAGVGGLGKRSQSGFSWGYGVGGLFGGAVNGTAHNNMPPYTVGTWFIYAA